MRAVPIEMAVLGLCVVAQAASAQANAEFDVGGVRIAAPLPTGFCTPAGQGVEVAQIVAGGDKENVTDLTLFPCEDQSGTAPDYYLVKTPASTFTLPAPRGELLAGLKVEFDKPEFADVQKSADATAKASKSLSEIVQQKAEMTGTIDPMGLDETCAYLGGVLKVEAGAINYKRAVGGCIRSVGDRVVIIYRYHEGLPANVLPAMRSAKAFAQSMRVVK